MKSLYRLDDITATRWLDYKALASVIAPHPYFIDERLMWIFKGVVHYVPNPKSKRTPADIYKQYGWKDKFIPEFVVVEMKDVIDEWGDLK